MKPIIVFGNLEEGLALYTDFDQYVGTAWDDPSHCNRLLAAVHLLNYVMINQEKNGAQSISDITPIDIYVYEQTICPTTEVVYVGEFLYNLACDGRLKYVKPENILYREEWR